MKNHRARTARTAVWAVISAAVLSGCGMPGGELPDKDTSKPGVSDYQVALGQDLLAGGQIAYQRHCIGCHGAEGDGKGVGADALFPEPRNFQEAAFRFSSTRSGQLPTDDDLKRTIRYGLKGSAMPAFRWLPESTLDGLVLYIKTFSDRWERQGPGPRIPFVEDPYRADPDKSAAIARGERVYHGFATCWNCHPSYVNRDEINAHLVATGGETHEGFRDDLDLAIGKANAEGQMVYPPDFLRDFVRSGSSVEDLYRSIAAGITGTAMPTWVDSMDIPAAEEGEAPLIQQTDLWAMAYYVQSLIARRPPRLTETQVVVRDRPTVPPPATETEEAGGAEEVLDEDALFGD